MTSDLSTVNFTDPHAISLSKPNHDHGDLSDKNASHPDLPTPDSIRMPGHIVAPKIPILPDSQNHPTESRLPPPPSTQPSKKEAPATPASVPTTPALAPVPAHNPLQPQSVPDKNLNPSNPPPPTSSSSSIPQPLNLTAYHPNAKNTTTVNTNGTTTTKLNTASPVCRNCKTQTTPLWRRDETGQVLCNACGLFLKLHGRPRPISLKTDTIKSRNRVKQPLPHPDTILSLPGIGQSPNTHPVKPPSPDARSRKGLKLPRPKKQESDPHSLGMSHAVSDNGEFVTGRGQNLTPLLPAVTRGPGASHIPHNSNSPHTSSAQPSMHPSLPSYLSGHHVVQPLHYPSSTPTQFAPGLQRITSPLLLLTVSNARLERGSLLLLSNEHHAHHSAALSAAGALETMAHELGPSATFRPGAKPMGSSSSSGSGRGSGVLLLGQDRSRVKSVERNPVFSAMNAHPAPPKLPALGHSLLLRNSPAFGPQFAGDLPPLQTYLSAQSTKQGLGDDDKSGSNARSDQPPNNQTSSSESNSNPNQSGRDDGLSNNNNNNNNNNQNNNQANDYNNNGDKSNGLETTLLRTRISELELVNDLYRTRIMELEAMEQAARLRESSMRKRLDEVLILNGFSAVPRDQTNVAESNADGRLSGHVSSETAFPQPYSAYAQPSPSNLGAAPGKRAADKDAVFGDSKRAK